MQEFISLEMIALLEEAAQWGCEYSALQLQELGVWEKAPTPNSNERPCQCGSGQPWVSCTAVSQYCG